MTGELFLNNRIELRPGDCRDVLRSLPDASIDSVVTDPPYALVSIVKRFGGENAAPAKGDVYGRAAAGFMGQQWDTGETAFAVEFWREVMRVLKPGGHVVAFSGTRTYHRLAVAIEDAGFEIRDQLQWLYGSGFPKSHSVARGIDDRLGWFDETERAAGLCSHVAAYAEGWGTALKPACEPIVLARKPLVGTVAANVLEHGTGAIHIDGCRVESYGGSTARGDEPSAASRYADRGSTNFAATPGPRGGSDKGRWPANILHDGSPEVVACFPDVHAAGSARDATAGTHAGRSGMFGLGEAAMRYGDAGSPARFFYSAKADAHDRVASEHPTVKPVDLMQWLCRLVTPPGGVVLDPFAGSGTTGEAAWREGFRAILIEREAKYCDDIRRRLALAEHPTKRAAVAKAKGKTEGHDDLPLFGGLE